MIRWCRRVNAGRASTIIFRLGVFAFSRATAPLYLGIADSLGERDELRLFEPHRRRELVVVGGSAKHGAEPLGGAEQIGVLADETGVDRGVEPALLGRDV